jgi:predicted DNA binding CopG/RHH family protein
MENKFKVMTDDEEREFIEDFENNEEPLVNTLTPKRRMEMKAIARATLNPAREKITLRIPKPDLLRLKARALQEGMPYQTLINSILHKAVSR